jgi:hypothetical protein
LDSVSVELVQLGQIELESTKVGALHVLTRRRWGIIDFLTKKERIAQSIEAVMTGLRHTTENVLTNTGGKIVILQGNLAQGGDMLTGKSDILLRISDNVERSKP